MAQQRKDSSRASSSEVIVVSSKQFERLERSSESRVADGLARLVMRNRPAH
ncbi:hypothetical protein [Terrabacter sp. BE26]|uniref:hypothetical protein n=1 Tax=Terrabacter sp. BE26 TaxID=2898152 RepID=UPI0035BE75AA